MPAMDEKEFLQVSKEFHLEHFQQHHGSLVYPEFFFIYEILKNNPPKKYVEIGVGSGLTTALVKMSLDYLNLDCTIYAIDKVEHLYSDKSKSTGFIIDRLETQENVNLILGKTSLDLGQILETNSIDICFIDGDHHHPWSSIDTINILPYMKKPGILIYDDIGLYKLEGRVEEIGPKHIFDQISGKKQIVNTPAKNLGSVLIDKEPIDYMENIIDALNFPWTCKPFITASALEKIIAIHYRNTPNFLEHIEKVFTRYGQTT